MPLTFGDYFAMPGNSGPSKQVQPEVDAVNFRHHSEFNVREPSLDRNDFSPPPNYNRAKNSYRTSYPPSKREMQDYAKAMNQFDNDGGTGPLSPGSSSRVSTDAGNRPRRSSLRQPGARHRNSTPPKRVRFSMTDTIFEPFDTQDSQTIDQIMQLLRRLPTRSLAEPSIPATSSYSITLRRSEAMHEYPDVVPPTRNVSSSAVSIHDEVTPYAVDSRAHPSRTLGVEQQRERTNNRGRRHSDAIYYSPRSEIQTPHRSPSYSGAQPPLRSPTYMETGPRQAHSASRSDVPVFPVEYRSDLQSPLHSVPQHKRVSESHYQPHSQRQAARRSEPHPRPRRESIPAPAPATASDRSSLGSEETLVNPEMTWAPAAVMFEYPQMLAAASVNEDKPVALASNDGNALRRKDAQRLPAVLRRHKLLRNITKMFD